MLRRHGLTTMPDAKHLIAAITVGVMPVFAGTGETMQALQKTAETALCRELKPQAKNCRVVFESVTHNAFSGGDGLWANPLNWDAIPDLSNVAAVSIPAGASSVTFDSSVGATSLQTISSLRPLAMASLEHKDCRMIAMTFERSATNSRA